MEELTRLTIQTLTGHTFKTCRPHWLKNPITGRNLELDGYNEYLGIAFEYNGIQHYKYTPRFHRNKDDLEYQVYKDRAKELLCLCHGVDLLVVPYSVGRHELCSYIQDKLILIRDRRRRIRASM